jgi:hypothetical protein|tara:strand:+ start:15173 stop:15331 length:159 start_codon:yes stop_codon:yes gene_type:complete
MSAGRRRLWWRHLKAKEILDKDKKELTKTEEEKEEEDGRLKSKGSKGRVSSP